MPSFVERERRSQHRQQRRLRPANNTMAVLIPFTYDSLRRCMEEVSAAATDERRRIPPLILDCRPSLSHSEGHIKGSLNVHCPAILRRRSGGRLPLRTMIPDAEVRDGLVGGAWPAVVLYEDHGLSSVEDSMATFVARCLQAETAIHNIYLLEGGFQRFRHHCPHLCTLSTSISMPSMSSESDPAGMKSTVAVTPRASRSSPRTSRCNSCSSSSGSNGPMSMSPPSSCTEQEVPVEILPYLYLGSAHHASSKDVLQRLGITALLNVSHTCPNHFEDSFTYKSIPVEDSGNEDIGVWFNEAIDFIERVKANNGKVLVHCEAGISRSATICMAYLMASKRLSMEDAYEYVKSRRRIISPNFNFMGQLLTFEAQVFASVNSTGGVSKCYKHAPSPTSPVLAILASSSPRSPLLAIVAASSPSPDSLTPSCGAQQHNVFNFALAQSEDSDHLTVSSSAIGSNPQDPSPSTTVASGLCMPPDVSC